MNLVCVTSVTISTFAIIVVRLRDSLCKKLVRASTCAFFRALILKLLGLGFYKKICLKEGEFFVKCFSEIY